MNAQHRSFPKAVFSYWPRGLAAQCLVLFLAGLLVLSGIPAVSQSQKGPGTQGELTAKWKMLDGEHFAAFQKVAGVPEGASVATRANWRTMSGQGGGSVLPSPAPGGAGYCALTVEFANAPARTAFERALPRNVKMLTSFDRFADVFIPAAATPQGGLRCDADARAAIDKSPGVVWFEILKGIRPPGPPTFEQARPSRQIAETIVRDGVGALRGQGVIIAVIDSGIDYTHPDFITTDAAGQPTSRILYLWDTFSETADTQNLGDKAPYAYPNGRSIGTLYTRAQLTADLRAGTRRIPIDTGGHGTACAGVAAGNGRAINRANKNYIGVAPEADLIVVRIGGAGQGLENVYLLNAAVAWIDQVARREGKPLVISGSFGGHDTGHDGSSVSERELDARFASNPPGRAMVIAAGNEQRDGIHARGEFTTSQNAGGFFWEAGEKGAMIHFYVRGGGTAAFDPDKIMFAPAQQAGVAPVVLKGNLNLYVYPLSGDLVGELVVNPGKGGLYIWNEAGTPTVADAYILGDEDKPPFSKFDALIQRPQELVGSPGDVPSVITVGSYAWNDVFTVAAGTYQITDSCGQQPMAIGALSCYSSPGPSRKPGVVKPDIVAPGEWYPASYARGSAEGITTNPKAFPHVDATGYYLRFNGTSAATPYTAGVIALMMQKKPGITISEIKDLFRRNASRYSPNDRLPNPQWGYGKLDLRAVQAILNSL